MSEYSEGVVHDGAAILKDGELMTISEILDGLKEIQALKEKVRALEKENTTFKGMIENGLGWEDMVNYTLYP